MTVVDTLITEYKANTTDYQKGVDQSIMGTQKFSSAVSMGIGTLKKFATAVIAVGGALATFSVMASQKAADFDAMIKSLEAVVGGAEDAKKALEELREIAAMPGLGLEEAIRGYTSLRRAGLDDELAMRTIRSAGNANALASGGRAELEQILRGISQIALKPNLSGEELMQLNEAGIPASKIISEMFGTADGGELKKLGVTSKEALEALVEGMEGFPKASGSAKNSIENLGMAVDMAVVAIGTAINSSAGFGIDNIATAIENVTAEGLFTIVGEKLIDLFSTVFPVLGSSTLEDTEGALAEMMFAVIDVTEALRNLALNIADIWNFIKAFTGLGQAVGMVERTSPRRASDLARDEYELRKWLNSEEGKEHRAKMRGFNSWKEFQDSKKGSGEYDWERAKRAVAGAKGDADNLADQTMSYLREQLAWSRRAALAAETLVELNKSFFGSSSYGENVLSPVNLSGSPSGGLVGAMQGMIQMELIKAMERR